MLPPLSVELWLRIFQGMSYPPIAHRKSTDPEPMHLQRELAALCATSKTFHSLASPLLYKYPIVRSLPKFIHGLNNPSIPGLDSKRQLLAGTGKLYLEESAEPEARRPPGAVHDVSWGRMGHELDRREAESAPRRLDDADNLLGAWRTIIDDTQGPSGIFSNLITVSVGATVTRPAYWPTSSQVSRYAKLHHQCRDALYEFLTKATTVRHFCQLGRGPLSLENRLFFSQTNRNLSLTTHSTIDEPIFAPIFLGLRFKWIVHPGGDRDDASGSIAACKRALPAIINLFDND